jgi:hypothetical protein
MKSKRHPMKKALLIIVPIIAIVVVGVALYCKNTSYYFSFDEVVYYKTKIGWDELSVIDRKKIKTVNDSMTMTLMGDYNFESIPDNRAVTYLDNLDFEKKTIPVSKHELIREVFREKLSTYYETTLCEPIYRDVYVFKQNGEITGIAKLCYECGLSSFTGTSADTEDFGADGEFEKLKELVK